MPLDQTGGLFRKDGSGNRGTVELEPVTRQKEFPYDMALKYGQVSQDDDTMEIGPKNPWAKLSEVIGAPTNFGLASGGERTNTVPGGPEPSGSAWPIMPAAGRIFSRGTSSNLSSRMGEAWVSLASLPVMGMDPDSVSVEDDALDSLKAEFARYCAQLERDTSSFSKLEKILMMIDLDPEHTARSLADSDAVDPDYIYRSWRDPALPSPREGEDER